MFDAIDLPVDKVTINELLVHGLRGIIPKAKKPVLLDFKSPGLTFSPSHWISHLSTVV